MSFIACCVSLLRRAAPPAAAFEKGIDPHAPPGPFADEVPPPGLVAELTGSLLFPGEDIFVIVVGFRLFNVFVVGLLLLSVSSS